MVILFLIRQVKSQDRNADAFRKVIVILPATSILCIHLGEIKQLAFVPVVIMHHLDLNVNDPVIIQTDSDIYNSLFVSFSPFPETGINDLRVLDGVPWNLEYIA